jgi:hypothetical protein
MTCPSAIAGTVNKAVTKRYFDPSLMRGYSYCRVGCLLSNTG